MAPTLPRSDRATRASTRSQTAKSQDTSQRSGKIEKTSAKAPNKAKKAARSKPKPKTKTKPKPPPHSAPKQPTKADKEAAEPNAPATTPSNTTVLTIHDDRVKTPITCHRYAPSIIPTPTSTQTTLIFTHGAGGTLSAPAMLHFCTGFSSASPAPLLAFQGSMNLGARVKGFHACYAHTTAGSEGADRALVFGGRSMGARAAVMAASEIAEEGVRESVRLVLVSYPLQGPKDVRDRILLDLREGVEVLFVVGERDAMCPLELLEEVRGKMKAVSRVVVVRGADHGMNVRPARRTREVGEETGRVAARWLGGEVDREGGVLFVGDEE